MATASWPRRWRSDGWGAFWLGVLAEHIDHDPETAANSYAAALPLSRQHELRLTWLLREL